MSGGIIITRRAILLNAVKDPALYDQLPQGYKNKVDAIDAAGPSACTQDDLDTLARCIRVAVHC